MSNSRIVEHFACADWVATHRFKIDQSDSSMIELSTGLRPDVRYLRDYVEFSVRDVDATVICRSSCSWQVRDLTPEEIARFAGTDLVASVTWSTGWSPQWDSKLLHLGLTKSFVVDFFCFYKIIAGNGKKVGDTYKDVLVYVDLSTPN